MLKWLLVVVVCIVLLGVFQHQLARFGLGKLPGDLHFTKNGRQYYIPITSTLIISLALTLITRFI